MEDGEAEIVFDDEEDLAGEFGEIEAFSEEPSGEDDFALDLGMMEDSSDEEAAEPRMAVAEESSTLDIPDELADISDLSPPEKTIFDDEPEAKAGLPPKIRSRTNSISAPWRPSWPISSQKPPPQRRRSKS